LYVLSGCELIDFYVYRHGGGIVAFLKTGLTVLI
jgi:hypothetical protein